VIALVIEVAETVIVGGMYSQSGDGKGVKTAGEYNPGMIQEHTVVPEGFQLIF
jgi:hypothetical protein